MAEQRHVEMGYSPRPWQREVHLGLDGKRWGVLVCHRRAGKTVLSVAHMIDRAGQLTLPDGRYSYLAPQLKQAKAIAWHYLKRFCSQCPGAVVSEGELHVTLPHNRAQIRIHGGDNPDSLRGPYTDGVILDEAADLDPDLWDSVLRPQLADRNGWALFLGTPKGINLLSQTYFAALERSDWYAGLYTVRQTDALPAKEVADLERDMTSTAFRREFLCDFNASADDVLLSVDEVETASKRNYNEGDYQHSAKVIGVDVARHGDDSTVIQLRQGVMAWEPIELRGADAMQVADRVAHEINEWKPDGVFIDGTGGYGGGVIDRLRQLGHKVIDVQFAGTPTDAKFLNKRAEMWWQMAQWVKRHGAIPPVQRLKLDLCAATYGYNSSDKLVLESKEAMKDRGLPSPDFADALAVTFSAPVRSEDLRTRDRLMRQSQSHAQRFDPLARVRHIGR
jgi:hypothetical protein